MTSPAQAFIGRSGQQVGAAWPLRPLPPACSEQPEPRRPRAPPSRGHPWGQCCHGGVPAPEVTAGTGCIICAHERSRPKRPASGGCGVAAPGPRRGRPVGAGERRGVRARAHATVRARRGRRGRARMLALADPRTAALHARVRHRQRAKVPDLGDSLRAARSSRIQSRSRPWDAWFLALQARGCLTCLPRGNRSPLAWHM